jgi:serine/threonine-protein kinase
MTYMPQMTEAEADHTIIERRDPLVGNVLDGRFRIAARLAAGGFGAIYRATDLGTSREVALKVLHNNLTADPLIVARFRREGEMLANLRDPHTVTAYELGEAADGTLYIVMELLRGETLYDAYKKHGGPLPWRRVTAIARAVCSSLAEAHERGIVHRDLKPANIHLQERDGNRDFVKVLDFGIAKIVRGGEQDQAELTQVGQMIGTFDYMAPEQMLGGVVGARCDIYTLGVVMYEMLTGRLPFADATSPTHLLAMLLTTTPPLVASIVPVPPALDRIVMRCLEREQQDRFESVIEIAAALDGVLAGRGAEEGPTVASRTPCADEPTVIAQRAVRGSAPVIAAPAAAPRGDGPPTHLTDARGARLRDAIAPAAPIEPMPVRAAGSQPKIAPRNDGRGSQPPMRNDGRGSQPPMRAPVDAYDSTVPAHGRAAQERARVAQAQVHAHAHVPQPTPPRAMPRATPPIPPAGYPQSIDPCAVAYPRAPGYADARASQAVMPAYAADRRSQPVLDPTRASQPVLDPSRYVTPPIPYPIVDARGSQPVPMPIADARGSQPYLDARASQLALAAGSGWQPHHHAARGGLESAGFDAARDAAVRRIVWGLVLVLGVVLAIVVAKLL